MITAQNRRRGAIKNGYSIPFPDLLRKAVKRRSGATVSSPQMVQSNSIGTYWGEDRPDLTKAKAMTVRKKGRKNLTSLIKKQFKGNIDDKKTLNIVNQARQAAKQEFKRAGKNYRTDPAIAKALNKRAEQIMLKNVFCHRAREIMANIPDFKSEETKEQDFILLGEVSIKKRFKIRNDNVIMTRKATIKGTYGIKEISNLLDKYENLSKGLDKARPLEE